MARSDVRRCDPVTGSGRVVLVLAALSCTSTANEPIEHRGVGGATAGSSSGGNSTGGSGGSAMSGSGGAFGGSGGASGSDGVSGAAGSAGTGGSGGAAAGNGGAGGSERGGDGGAGMGGESGSSGARGGAGSGGHAGMGGSAGGTGPVGCDFANAPGKLTLFDGTSFAGWQNSTTGGPATWRIVGDGSMEVVPANPSTNIETTMQFEDLCLHLEYMTPMYPANVTGQERGNSGIYFKRAYEMQVLDSYGQPPLIDGCGAVYGVAPPLVVACNMQLVWNTYEIEFRGSRWNASGTKTENAAFVSATLNGRLVQRDVELAQLNTTAGQPDAAGPRALMLQDHGNLVRFRNLWATIPRR